MRDEREPPDPTRPPPEQSAPPPPPPTVSYVKSVAPYRAVSERTFGGATRYEAEAPTAEEASELLKLIEKKRDEAAIETDAHYGLKKMKRQRDELRQVLRAVIAETYSYGVCCGCGHPEEEMHAPDCAVQIAARCLPPI